MYLTLPLLPPPHYLLLPPYFFLLSLGGPASLLPSLLGWCYPTGRCAYLPSVICYRQSIKPPPPPSPCFLPPHCYHYDIACATYRVYRDRERVTHTHTNAHTHTHTHTHHTCIQASSQAIRREQSIPQIGQGSTHVAHHDHVMPKQQSFKRGGRGDRR